MRSGEHHGAVECDRLKENPCWIVVVEQRLEAELNIAEILNSIKNGWAGSILEFKNGTNTNPQGFGNVRQNGEPQDGPLLPKEWTARASYRWLRRKTDGGKFTKRVAAKRGLGEEQFKAWKITLGSIRVDNIIKGFKWRLVNKILPTSDRLSRHRLVDAVWNCPLRGISRESVEHMFFFRGREIKAAYTFWIVLASKCMSPTGTAPAITRLTCTDMIIGIKDKPRIKRSDKYPRVNAIVLNMGSKE